LAWIKYGKDFNQKFEPIHVIDFISQPLWGNPRIDIEFIQQWYNKGINFVRDIINTNGNLKIMDELKSEFGINITFLDLYRIKHAIMPTWLNIIANTADRSFPCVSPQLFAILSLKRGCSKYSNILAHTVEDKTPPPALSKWKRPYIR
jgi:hypothetical protein